MTYKLTSLLALAILCLNVFAFPGGLQARNQTHYPHLMGLNATNHTVGPHPNATAFAPHFLRCSDIGKLNGTNLTEHLAHPCNTTYRYCFGDCASNWKINARDDATIEARDDPPIQAREDTTIEARTNPISTLAFIFCTKPCWDACSLLKQDALTCVKNNDQCFNHCWTQLKSSSSKLKSREVEYPHPETPFPGPIDGAPTPPSTQRRSLELERRASACAQMATCHGNCEKACTLLKVPIANCPKQNDVRYNYCSKQKFTGDCVFSMLFGGISLPFPLKPPGV